MKKSALITLGIAGLLAATAAWAGYKGTWPVYVDTLNRTAGGSLGSTRNSTDSSQYIGCYTYAYSSGSEYALCIASTSAGAYASCWSSVPQIINVVRSLNGDGYVYFRYDTGGQCTYVEVQNYSTLEPKAL